MLLVDAEAVRLGGERRGLHHVGVRVLGGQPGEHRVVTGDGVDLALLEQHEAAGVGVGRHGLDVGEVRELGQARRPGGGADPLPARSFSR